MLPKLIQGGAYHDVRGTLCYNNDFDATSVKRIYIIENQSTDLVRAWQGHKIEQRWFSGIIGSFKIQLIAIDDWGSPSKDLERFTFIIDAEKLDVLCIPAGYVSSIQSLEEGAKLLVMADYLLGDLQDEYRYTLDYFD